MRRSPSPRAVMRGFFRVSLLGAVIAAASVVPAAAEGRSGDADGDGLSNRFERERSRTKPHHRDTDRDRLSDGFEVRRSKTSPRRRDTDRDGLADGFEVRRSKTSPRRRDTDLDGVADRLELFFGTDPLTPPPASRGLVSGGLTLPAPPPQPHSPQPAPALPDQALTPEPPAPVAPAPSGDCDRDATPATFASEVSAATAGQSICLASGSYGTWGGTGKAITIRPQAGASPTMRLNLGGSSDGNFTIDGGRAAFSETSGLTLTGADITGPVHDLTVRNAKFTGGVKFLSHPHPNVVFDHNEHVGIPASATGAIILPGGSQVHSGVTIRNSYFHELEGDGIQTGPAIDVLNNEFARLDPNSGPAHSDAIQLYCGCGAPGVGSLVKGNYAHDGEQGIVAFDGSGDHVIEDNVVWNFRVHGIVLGGDTPASQVRHNTVGGSGRNQIDCSSKSGFSPSQTAIYDNIAQYVGLSGAVDCTPSRNDHNMVRQSGGAGNFLGNPQFAGGPNPTTYAGFRLAPGSPGSNAASDGQDVGIR
jgi:Right handed beta helix region/Bacterial TSP3 repeat